MSFGLHATIKGKGAEVFSLRFAPGSGLLAAATNDGYVRLYDWKTQREVKQILVHTEKRKAPVPVMCISLPGGSAKGTMLAVCSDGFVSHWDPTKGKCLNSFYEEGNEVYSADYSADGTRFCTGGLDRRIRLYDGAGTPVAELGTPDALPHSNRISAVVWSRQEPSLLVSGGWDNVVKLWDCRDVRHPIRTLFGPYIAGEGLDIHGTSILTGSARPNNQIEIWDTASGQRQQLVQWPSVDDACVVYTCRFSHHGKYIVAGGAFSSEALVFSRDAVLDLGGLHNVKRSLYCACFSSDDAAAALAGADGNVYIIHYGARKVDKKTTETSPVISKVSRGTHKK